MKLLYVNLLMMSIWAGVAFTQNNHYNKNYEWVSYERMSFPGNRSLLLKQLEKKMLESAKTTLRGLNLKNYNLKTDGSRSTISQKATCEACGVSVATLVKTAKTGISRDNLKKMVTKMCHRHVKTFKTVCKEIIDLNFDIVLYIIKKTPEMSGKKVCSIILQHMSCTDPNRKDWSVDIPDKKSNFDYRKVASKSKSKPIKILQLTDLHHDPGYKVGSNADCGEYLCCQAKSKAKTEEVAAGIWGDYRKCDTPWNAFEDAIDHILAQHPDIDVVYFVGDIIAHLNWATSKKSNTETLRKVYGYLNKKFGKIPTYYILGNHEPHPVNVFAPENIDVEDFRINWLYELAVEKWNLPKDTRETILRGGYYTTLVKPGFRIIALNSNICFIFNWWLLYNDVDPYGQLKWLVQVLLKAEKNKEIVHILSHVPSNDEQCLRNWAEQYAKIIKRFSNVIAAQFNGHTHYDDFIAYFEEKTYEQYSIAFNGGSVTTYDNLNPNYKIYYANPSTLEVVDAESWTYNITSANLNPKSKPKWYKLYSFTKDFGVSPSSVKSFLFEELIKNEKSFQKFFGFKHRDALPSLMKGCDKDCRIKTICDMVTPYFGYTETCKHVKSLFK